MGRPGVSACRTNTGRIITAQGLGSTINVTRYSDAFPPATAGTIADLDSPFVGNPNLPTIAARRSQVLDCVWGGPGGAIRLASSTDRGRTFGAAVAVQASGYQNPSCDWDDRRQRLYVALQDTVGLDWFLSYADLDSSGVPGSWSTPALIVAAASDEVACLRVRGDGTLGFAWSDGGAVKFQTSGDGGATWSSPVIVIGSGFRNPTFCWDPHRQRVVLALQSNSVQTILGFSSLSWFSAVSTLDADGPHTAFTPTSFDPTLTAPGFVITLADPAAINFGWPASHAGACMRCEGDGKFTFAHLANNGSGGPLLLIPRSGKVPNTGLARATWQA